MGKRRAKKRKIPVARRKTRKMPWLFFVLMFLVAVNCYVFLWRGETSIPAVMEKAAVAGDSPISKVVEGKLAEGKNPSMGAGSKLSFDKASEHLAGQTTTSGDGRIVNQAGHRVGGGDEFKSAKPSLEKTTGMVADGESLGAILTREGLDANSSDALLRALASHLDFRKIQAGQRYSMHFDDQGQLIKFEFEVTRIERVIAQRSDSGGFETHVWKATTEVRRHQVGGTIESSLYKSVKNLGEDTGLVSYFIDIFAYDVDFHVDTQPGDTFRIVVEKEYYEDEFWALKRVVAAEYNGLAGDFKAYWWDGLESNNFENAGYYTQDGESLEKTFLKTPLKFSRISSRFNAKRMHPVLHVRRGHFGVDYSAPPGTPVWAAANGKIVERRRKGGAGNVVTIKHGNNLETSYMHLSKFFKGQAVGQRVSAKDVIGYVGSTGLATGPHLHFGVKKNGHHIDPFKLKMKRSRSLAEPEMAQYKSQTQELVVALSEIKAAPMRNPVVVELGTTSENSLN